MIVRIFTISGHSMLPVYQPSQKIITSTLPYLFSNPKVNDVIVFKNKGKTFIKRITENKGQRYFVKGDNTNDSNRIGWIAREDIIGKVICTL